MQESLEESNNSGETESDDDTVTLKHKTPLKVDVNKHFKTKTMQQQEKLLKIQNHRVFA